MRWDFLILALIFFTFTRGSQDFGSVDTDAECVSDSDDNKNNNMQKLNEIFEYFNFNSDSDPPVTPSSVTNEDSEGAFQLPSGVVQLPNYPPVHPSFDPQYYPFLNSVLDEIPHFRSSDTFKVSTMQDLRYIRIVLESTLGPLSRVFRFEYDWNAIEADCKSEQDFTEFRYFLETHGEN